MPARRSDADCVVRTDPGRPPLLRGTAPAAIASTRAFDGAYEDRTGPLPVDSLRGRGLEGGKELGSDGPGLGAAIARALETEADVVSRTGGTGISPSDVAPEQTAPFIERAMPGVLEAVRRLGADTTPAAVLSRGVAGM